MSPAENFAERSSACTRSLNDARACASLGDRNCMQLGDTARAPDSAGGDAARGREAATPPKWLAADALAATMEGRASGLLAGATLVTGFGECCGAFLMQG